MDPFLTGAGRLGGYDRDEEQAEPYYASRGPNFYEPYRPALAAAGPTPPPGYAMPEPPPREPEAESPRYDDLVMTDFQMRSGLQAIAEAPPGEPPALLAWPLPDVSGPTLCSLLGLGARTGLERLLDVDERD